MSPEARAALEAIMVMSRWLPQEIGPVAYMGLQLAERALEREQDPVAYMKTLLEADAQRLAREKFG